MIYDIISPRAFLANTRRTPKNPLQPRGNPLEELVAEKELAAHKARATIRVQKAADDLPALIDNQVGEQINRLENRLLEDFRMLGERAAGESTAALTEQLGSRIESLEKVSAMQSETLVNLRNSSKIADKKVSFVVNEIEKSLADAVPGFKLPEPAYARGIHPQFQIRPGTEVIKADPRNISEADSKFGVCPNCTSTSVRRANRSGLFEEVLRLFFIAPFRCRACRHKFYRF